MRRPFRLAVLLAAIPAAALAQQAPEPGAPPPPEAAVPPGSPPPEPPPAEAPPPPQVPPEAPSAGTPPPVAAPAGQWVHTIQYGWLWIPYAPPYTYVPGNPRIFPDQYVYYPAYGWRWVVAPWVYGYGPAPYWGALGPRPFAWYARPWFRVGGYWGWGGYRGWGRYRGWIGPRAWGARGWREAPPYYRTGAGGRHPVPGARPHPAPRRGEHEGHRGERRGGER